MLWRSLYLIAKKMSVSQQAHGTGYGGSGFKFDTEEDAQRKAVRKVHCKPLQTLLVSSAVPEPHVMPDRLC